MTDTDRARLAAILGMLGSAHAGERAAAALQAEAFRRKHGLSWEQVMATSVVYIERPPVAVRPRFSFLSGALVYVAWVCGALLVSSVVLHQFGIEFPAGPQCAVAAAPQQSSLQTAR